MFRKTRRSLAGSGSTSLVATDTTLRGDITFSGTLHVCGCVIGNVRGDGEALFTLSAEGVIEGSVLAPQAVINGTVRGDIHATQRLQLAAAARVEGDVRYRSLEMAAGAQVNGRMLHDADAPKRLAAPDAAET
jgi:cytoskeletal protein CcmA (bactofilin family)